MNFRYIFWYILLPLLLGGSYYIAYFIGPDFYNWWAVDELGVMENFTPMLAIPTVIVAIRTMRLPTAKDDMQLKIWLGIYCICAIYFAGEALYSGEATATVEGALGSGRGVARKMLGVKK